MASAGSLASARSPSPSLPPVSSSPSPPPPAAAAASELTYGNDMYDGTSLIATQAENASDFLKSLSKYVKEKAELDRHYCKTLRKITERLAADIPPLDKDNGSSSLTNFMHSFVGLGNTLATNYEILAAKLDEQVSKPLTATRDSHAEVLKKMGGDAVKYTRLQAQKAEDVHSARTEAIKAEAEAQHALRKALGQEETTMLDEVLGAFREDAATLSRRAQAADARYRDALSSMQKTTSECESQLVNIRNAFQKAEYERVIQSSASLKDYLNIHHAMFASCVKNAHAVAAQVDKVNPTADQQAFIKTNLSHRPPLHSLSQSALSIHHLYAKITGRQTSATGELLSSSSSLIDSGSGSRTPRVLDAEDKNLLAKLFGTREGRVAFANLLNSQREQKRFLLSQTAFDQLTDIILMFLDACKRTKDYGPVHSIMLSSQVLYMDNSRSKIRPHRDGNDQNDDDNDDDDETITDMESFVDSSNTPHSPPLHTKTCLVTAIRDHSIWDELTYWSDAFNLSLKTRQSVSVSRSNSDGTLEPVSGTKASASSSAAAGSSSTPLSKEKLASLAFATLTSFSKYMSEFNLDKDTIRDFVETMAKSLKLKGEQMELVYSLDCFQDDDDDDNTVDDRHDINNLELEDDDNDGESGSAAAAYLSSLELQGGDDNATQALEHEQEEQDSSTVDSGATNESADSVKELNGVAVASSISPTNHVRESSDGLPG